HPPDGIPAGHRNVDLPHVAVPLHHRVQMMVQHARTTTSRRPRMYNIDHFMIAANDLDRLADHFTRLTGVPVAGGGSHPDLGTRNKLIATTSSVYLELIAPDPNLSARSDLLDVIEQIGEPVVRRMIVLARLSEFPAIVQAYERAGVPAVVRPLSRATATGDVLRWHLLMPAAANEFGIFAPLFID